MESEFVPRHISPNVKKILDDPNFKLGINLPPSKHHLMSLAELISRRGGKLEEGMKVVLEASINKLQNAVLLHWDTTKDEKDPNNFGYYHQSLATIVLPDGKQRTLRFSMLFVEKTSFEVMLWNNIKIEVDPFKKGLTDLSFDQKAEIHKTIMKFDKPFGEISDLNGLLFKWRRKA